MIAENTSIGRKCTELYKTGRRTCYGQFSVDSRQRYAIIPFGKEHGKGQAARQTADAAGIVLNEVAIGPAPT